MSTAASTGAVVTLAERMKGSAAVALRGPAQARVPYRSADSLERIQARRVRASVAYAHSHVPYYRETMRRLGLSPSDFRTAGDLARLPVIERSQLQADPEYFASDECAKAWIHLRSGGSTGHPVSVFRDPASVFGTTIHAQRLRSLVAGIVGRFRFRELVVAAPSGSADTLAMAFRRSSLISPAVRSRRMVRSLFTQPADHVDAIDEYRPEVIGSYGSFIEALFVHREATGRPRHLPKVVTYAADPMSEPARGLITGLGVRVLSAYQAIESGQVGFECERNHGFHVNSDFCPVRIVDAEGRALPRGESGEVVISDLTNRATVLLNYRLGDMARAQPPCSCGRNLPMISLIEGRTVEWLRGPAGERIHPQTALAVLRFGPGIRRYQVRQHSPTHVEVLVVLAAGAIEEGARDEIASSLAEHFPPGMRFTVRPVPDLPRTPGGKVRPVVSLIEGG